MTLDSQANPLPATASTDAEAAPALRPKTAVVPFGADSDASQLLRCVRSLQTSEPAFDEIIVALDGASDARLATLRPLLAGPRTRLVEIARPSGPAAARNAAVQASTLTGGLLVFVDADVEAGPDFSARVDAVFRAHPELDACFGSYDDEPAAPGFFSQYRNLLHHFVHQQSEVEAETFWAGCGAIRREVFRAAHGFCPSFDRPSIEDVELGMRLRAQGRRIRLEKTLLVKHFKGWTMTSMLWTDLRSRAIPWVRLLWRHRHVPNTLNTSRAQRGSLLAAVGGAALVAVAGSTAAGLIAATIAAAAFLLLNRKLLRFLAQKRGVGFALAAVFWLWIYYGECALALAWVGGEIASGRLSGRSSPPARRNEN